MGLEKAPIATQGNKSHFRGVCHYIGITVSNCLEPATCWALVCGLFQESSVEWQPMWREPILAVKLYFLLVVASLFVAVAHFARNWILLPPFKHVQAKSSRRAAAVFRRQALALRRWAILNVLGWVAVTLAGLLNLLRGLSVSRTVGLPVMAFALEDLLEPSVLFLWVLIIFYVVRWHILWRAERLERLQHGAPTL